MLNCGIIWPALLANPVVSPARWLLSNLLYVFSYSLSINANSIVWLTLTILLTSLTL